MLSGGRAVCGLGLAWFKQEHPAYGWPFPSTSDRYALLEDALQVLPMLWGPGNPAFDGRVLSLPDTTCYPRPLQHPCRSSSAAEANAARCGWQPSTPTRPT